MRVVEKEEFEFSLHEFARRVLSGAVFVHPTDTIYGLGCDATNSAAVRRLREIKNRPSQPFSVIAPSVDWIREYCEVSADAEAWLQKLPGPYTLILKLKKENGLAPEVNPGLSTVGVRLPDHWFTEHAQSFMVPIVTTSVNKVGGEFMTSLENLDSDIRSSVDFILYEGEKIGSPSQIVDLTKPSVEVRKR